MWAHYANGHIGFRVDFTLNKNDMNRTHRVKYGCEPKSMKITECYSMEDKKISEIDEILIRKDKVWKYEREWRTILNDNKFVKINIERVAIGRGFLPVVFDCDRSKSIPRNIEDLSYALKGLLKNEKIKISIYKSRYDDELIDI